MDKAAIKKKVLAEIDRRADEIIEYANAIWKYPELGFKEFKTAELTEAKYKEMGWRYEKEIAITGSKAYLKGDGSRPSVGVVGELDALWRGYVGDRPVYLLAVRPESVGVAAGGQYEQG